MDNNSPRSTTQSSPLHGYGLILGRRWSDLEFEDRAAVRLGLRRGLLTLDADRRVRPVQVARS